MASPGTPSPHEIAEDFGQRVDLTRRIREVLSNYPEGTTMLKELIQNADDAGATQVAFCLDRRQHGEDTLLYKELAPWQGPSLLAYNNAEFSADDFESISKLGGSKKGRQPWKTGRFGVGFNSVYHLSDLPSFVSGRHIVYFDPHCKFLPNVSAVNPGKRIDFVKSAALSYYKDQFLPYCMFGCDMKTPFQGTLFRFPLRTVSQAAQSQLSRQYYDEDDITQLFDELFGEASLCMLFLKNVETIKFYDWHPGSNNPCVLYSCSLASPTSQIRWHRHALTRLAHAWTSQPRDDAPMPKHFDSFVLKFDIEKLAGVGNIEVRSESFMIVQCMETLASRVGALSAVAANEYGVCLLPWAAVAAKISGDSTQGSSKCVNDGKAFCFLPLPLRTNLPIHVNGFFELSSNRRDIWHGTDMEGMGKIRADWNTFLLHDVVTSAYHHLLSVAPEDYRLNYTLWPSGSFVEPWKSMVDVLFDSISKYPILHSGIDGGQWLSLSQAVLHDEGMPNGEKQVAALIALRLPLVRIPEKLFERISTHCDAKLVCPSLLRQHLKRNGVSHIEWDSGLDFLEYCLGDVIDNDASAELSGLPLIPLANGKFGVFEDKRSRLPYFLCTEKQYFLMEKLKGKIINRDISQFLLQRMHQMAEASSVNISFLSITDLVRFLDEILPAEWKGEDVVQWLPTDKKGHPSEGWLVKLWEYLREFCEDLILLDSWPLLPINRGLLCRAKKGLGIVGNDGSLPKIMEKILMNLGCYLLRYDLCTGHPWLSKIVQSPSAMGILEAISCVALRTSHTILSELTSEHRRELRSFLLDARWYQDSLMKESHLQILKSLPIFEVYGVCGTKHEDFVDLLNSKLYLSPNDVDETLLSPDFIRVQSLAEIDVLTKVLAIPQMERVTFYKFTVIDKIADLTAVIRDQAILSILKELPVLCLHDPRFKSTLRNLAFVPTPSGELQSPKLLYDPRVEELNFLLNEKESFPSESFRTEEILDALRLLGLQTSISPNTIIQSARQVELMLKERPDEASARGFFLLSYLAVNAAKLFHSSVSDGVSSMFSKVTDMFQIHRPESDLSKKFWNELASICWCPVLVQSPHPGLPWPTVTTPLAPPKLVRLPTDLWLASASMRILNGDCQSGFLAQKLGWTSPLGGNVLAAQLLELGRDQAHAGSQSSKQTLATVIPKMYALLTDKLGTEELEIVKTILEGSQWVWIGDRFVSVHEAVLTGPLHLAPYMWVIPADLAVFKELLLHLGVKESLVVQDFASVLSKMATLKSNGPLDSLELKTAIWILQHLADLGFLERDNTLFIPDASGILLPSSQLVYNDAPWLLDESQAGGVPLDAMIDNRSLPRFVHANISNDVAERLSINSLRRSLLAESADSVNVTLHGAAEAFGQHEALTTRLKHIVDMYVDGPGILCELLQNSDDAGASEVSFLLDLSQYGSSSLLSPRMSDWQGPALYCFNNSLFTSKDLHAISRIGQDSKLEKPHAVGRFGLGFNSVYNFTDIPSFVSGNNLVIFDPHACHLPGISPSHPGLKINYVGKGLAQQFPDQCQPYMVFGCDLQHCFNGTLFRFPLRTSLTAARSQIKQTAYSPEMVLALLRDFQTIASEILLFLHSVTSINVLVREELGQEMHMLYKVSKHGPAYNNSKSVYTFIRTMRERAQDNANFYQKLHDIREDCLASDCQLVNITTDGIERQSTQVWIVSEYLGGRQAVTMASSLGNRNYGFVPWAGVAAKIGAESNFTKIGSLIEPEPASSGSRRASLEGRAFCFLPLPVKSGLPVHVNAYFELSSNRRDIWFGDDMAGGGKLRSEWNSCLLQEVASAAYVRMLAIAACQLGPSEEYYSLWPTGMPSEPWASLLRGVYVSAVELDMPVLFTSAKGGQWLPPRKAVFPDYSYSQAAMLGNALSDAGLSLLNAPASVVNQFQQHCPRLRYLTPQLLRSLLIRRQRALSSHEAMLASLKYCLRDVKNADSVQKLEGLPLIPLATGMFETFSCSSLNDKVFVADKLEFELLKDTHMDRLVDRNVDSELFEELRCIAEFEGTNLVFLSPVLLGDLLPCILPQDWHGKRLVHWNSGEAGHPSQAWIELLWRFLCSRSADLSMFTKWPILPTIGEHYLLQPIKGSCILMGDNWSENMVSLLHKANCFLLSSSFGIDHPQLREYVHDVSASGLLGALFAAAGGFKGLPDILKDISELEMQELRGFLMQKKWFVDDSMGAVQIEILKHLSIYKSYRTSTLVCLAKGIHYFPPTDVDVHLLGDEFVCPASDKEEEILTFYLGVKKLGKKEFFEDYAFKHLDSILPDIWEKVILKLLQDLASLEEEVPCIKKVLSQLEIVPTMRGKLKSPTELYDPRVAKLHSLIEDSFFPSTEFSETKVLEVLIELGLKTSLGLKDLLDSATSVASVGLIDEKRAFMMGKCLLAHIDRLGLDLEVEPADTIMTADTVFNPETGVVYPKNESSGEQKGQFEYTKAFESAHDASERITDRQFWVNLSGINWCPVLTAAPVPDLPWPKELKSSLVSPRIARPKSQMWHVSATMRIVDGEFCSRLMMSKLGWLEKPNLSILAMQLIELSKHHAQLQSEQSLRLDMEELDTSVAQFNKTLDEVVPVLYSLMEESLTSESAYSLKSMLEDICWVWVGDAFVLPTQAAFSSPSHFQPYLHVIPANLGGYQALLSGLGVKETFDVFDLANVLQHVSADRKGAVLNKELLDFVVRVLEAIYEILLVGDGIPSQSFLSAILVPDSNGFLTPARDLIYNDAPWLAESMLRPAEMKHFVNVNVPNELADRLGAKSLRYLSFVDKEMTKDLPCLSADNIQSILSKYGKQSTLIFDLLEIADKCKAQKVHILYDKRSHPETSVLQPNLGQFQGSALTVAFEGVELTTEEVCNLQLSPSWSRRGQNNNYGPGLLSCYTITNLLQLVSKGCFYLFDPSGSILAHSITNNKPSVTSSAQGKVYTLQETDIPQRFADQFIPFRFKQEISWEKPNVTILRMPLYTDVALGEDKKWFRSESSEALVDHIFETFIYHAPTSLLFLTSVEAVHLSKWEIEDPYPHDFFSVKVDPACSFLRNPFIGKTNKKFQLSTIFNSSNAVTKMNTIDVFINQDGNCIMDKWLVVLSFGCGQTKTLAIDRRFLSYNLSPVAGVAALVSRNGSLPSHLIKSTILCPLPLLVDCRLPVAILGCFIVSHDGCRRVFPNFSANEISVQSHQASLAIHSMWNQELMACVREAYIQLLSESMFVKQEISSKSVSHGNSQVPTATWKMLSRQSYLLWPMSQKIKLTSAELTEESSTDDFERDWLVKLLVRPVIVRLADLPVWKLHGGFLARATEGMFLSNPGTGKLHPPDAVCEFLKEHYKVFEVPCELTEELQDAQVNIKVITPKMVRYLMCTLLAVPKFSNVDRYIDLLEYSCADFSVISIENEARPDSSNIVALRHEDFEFDSSNVHLSPVEELALLRNRSSTEIQATGRESSDIVTNIRRAISQFGKVVEELSTEASQKISLQKQTAAVPGSTSVASYFDRWISELKGLPCPTAAANLLRLGRTEAWVGSFKQQKLLIPLAPKFIHSRCLDRPLLSKIFRNSSVQQALKIKPFTTKLLFDNMTYLLPRQWNRGVSQWAEWDYHVDQRLNSPTKEWLCLFWEHVGTSTEELLLFQHWPLVPAVLGSTVLVKVQYRHLIFMPPQLNSSMESNGPFEDSSQENSESLHLSAFTKAYTEVHENHPWLFPFLQHCKVPIFDQNFLDNEVVKVCLPSEVQTLGQAIRLKLVTAKDSGNLVVAELNMAAPDCDALFSLFANEFHSAPYTAQNCTTAELELLRSLPIHKTTIGTYTSIDLSVHCIVTPTAFFKPQSDLCLQHFPPELGGAYYKALGIQELSNSETLVKFCFPLFGVLSFEDRERALSYLYMHWEDLQQNEVLVDALRNTRFMSNGDENNDVLFQPQELLDPTVSLFREVFRGKKTRFPHARFLTNKWLDILRKAGLHSTLDAEALLGCAREVEDLGRLGSFAVVESQDFKELSTLAFQTAGHVVEAILANFAALYGSSFLEPLSEIAFVPTEIGLPFTNGSGGRRVLASYRQLVLLKDWPLAWTCAPILTNTSLIPPEFSWHSLRLKSPPHLHTVLEHIQNLGACDGEDILARWPSADDMITVEDAFLEILKYLEKHWESLSVQDKLILETVPFIPIANGTRLCLASRIFLHLEMNLAPFVFQLPNSYLPFVKLLTELGMQESPTFSRMQSLLNHVQNASGYQRLNPNELCAVMRVLDYMCKDIGSDNQHHHSTDNSVVPDDAGRLLHARACVYIDASASAMVSRIDTSRFRFVHPYLRLEYCICLGVRKLSEVVEEVIDESLPLEYIDQFGNISKAHIIEKLKSESFQDAVWTLLQDFSREMPSLEPLAQHEVARRLLWSAENLHCVKHLRTQFLTVSGKVDITREKRVDLPAEVNHSTYEFIDKQNGRIILAEPPDYVMMSEILSVMVSKVLGSPACLPLSGLFNVTVGTECRYLEIMRLRPYQDKYMKPRLDSYQGIAPGDELSRSDAAQVQVHPLRPYYSGEIVAWCSDFAPDTKLKYGIIVEDVRAPSGQAIYYLPVEICPGRIESLLSSNVFSFKSVLTGNKFQSLPKHIHSSPSSHSQAGDSLRTEHVAKDGSLDQDNEKKFLKNVQAAAVVHAVNDMMSAVGFPLGLEQKTLLSQALTLQEHLTAAQAALSSEQERANMAAKEAEAARASWMCRICLSLEVNSVLVPCGHVMCRNCSSAVSRCPFCRQAVTKCLNLYRP
ncbi:hypothetical protein GOP47_0018890 [Adiantum capillus-veneris]|uniref:RING-type domain-containing protein n=1 Tax=Adiantum capillus-veneris TaxID=13818 RepID=A0A9D4ZB49_ADICA|nr:hypothetical protein GOP47_0018890 [Adiantum capillus-veneris]